MTSLRSAEPRLARPRPRRLAVVVLMALLGGLIGVGGCGGDTDDTPLGGQQPTAEQRRAMEQRIVNVRARAIRSRDRRAFLRAVDRSDPALVERQKQWFENLIQLPIQHLSTRVLPTSWPEERVRQRDGMLVHAPRLRQRLQLASYDRVPAVRITGLVFGFEGGRARIIDDRTVGGKPMSVGPPQPWDLVPIRVRRSSHALGIFEEDTWGTSEQVMSAVDDGIRSNAEVIPFDWSEQVVVYALSSRRVLRTFRNVPGGNIEHLGAMTFPVYQAPGSREVASVRFVVLPSSVRAGPQFLGRITRHELSHVAVGVHDDGAPVWVAEGVAEWLGARPIPPVSRIIPTVALGRASGPVEGMPASKSFNGADQDWHYALSWMAMDHLAETRGTGVIWDLMTALHADGRGTPDSEQDEVLRRVLGLDSRELAQQAKQRIIAIYG